MSPSWLITSLLLPFNARTRITDDQVSPHTPPRLTLSTSNVSEPTHRAVLASPLLQNVEERDAQASVYHSKRGDTRLTLFVGSGEPEAEELLRNERKTSRDSVRSRERQVADERRRTQGQEQTELLHRREQEALRVEELAKQNVAETDLDEYRHVLDEQTNYEFRQCEEQAESAVRNLKTQLRQAGTLRQKSGI